MVHKCKCGTRGGVSVRKKGKKQYLSKKQKRHLKKSGNRVLFDMKYPSQKLPDIKKILKKFKKK